MSEYPKIKILSIDGGGIKGIIPCMILQKIEERTKKPISALFDVIAGTSTGGILTLGLTVPNQDGKPQYSASDILDLYKDKGSQIFPTTPFEDIKAIFRPKFDVRGLERLLESYFGNNQLNDVLTNVFITTYDIHARKPFYFSSRLAKKYPKENFLLKDIGRSTSAAPTYFKPHHINELDAVNGMVDGGVFANNPAVLAFTEAKEIFLEKFSPIKGIDGLEGHDPHVRPNPNDLPFFMLSLGTGNHTKPLNYEQAQKWGELKWVVPLIDILMQGVSETVAYQMEYIMPPINRLQKRYHRINPTIPDDATDMSDVTPQNIERLIKAAERCINKNEDLIEKICKIIE